MASQIDPGKHVGQWSDLLDENDEMPEFNDEEDDASPSLSAADQEKRDAIMADCKYLGDHVRVCQGVRVLVFAIITTTSIVCVCVCARARARAREREREREAHGASCGGGRTPCPSSSSPSCMY